MTSSSDGSKTVEPPKWKSFDMWLARKANNLDFPNLKNKACLLILLSKLTLEVMSPDITLNLRYRCNIKLKLADQQKHLKQTNKTSLNNKNALQVVFAAVLTVRSGLSGLCVASPVLWFPELLEDIAAIPDLRRWRSTEKMPSQFPKFPLIADTQKKTHPGKGNKKKKLGASKPSPCFLCGKRTEFKFLTYLKLLPPTAGSDSWPSTNCRKKLSDPGDPKEQGEAEADDETRPRRVEFGHDLICRPMPISPYFRLVFSARKGWTNVCVVLL